MTTPSNPPPAAPGIVNGLTLGPNRTATLYIDNTTLEAWQRCPRNGFYYAIRRIIVDAPQPALVAGAGLHEALRARYEMEAAWAGGSISPSVETLMRSVAANYFQLYPLSNDDWRSTDLVDRAIIEYNRAYPADPFRVARNAAGAPLVEIPIALPFGTFHFDDGECVVADHKVAVLDVVYTGKIDLIVEWDGHLCVIDHKTTSVGGEQFFDQFKLAGQTIGYCWAASKLLDKPITSFCVNAILWKRPTLSAGSKIEFLRRKEPYHSEHLSEWEVDARSQIEALVDALRCHRFPKHTSQCFGKYGRCQYHDICTTPPSQREHIITSGLYKPAEWSPLNA